MSEIKINNRELKNIAAEFLNGDKQSDLLDFNEFLQANNFKPRRVAKNAWEVKLYGNQILRRFRINAKEKSWSVNLHFFSDYNEQITNNELKNFVWNNIRQNRCQHEFQNCRNYSTINILGKNIDMVCCCGQITVIDPSGKALEHTKTLVLIAKTIVENALAEGKIEKSNTKGEDRLIAYGSPSK